jgi:hypothetical protein
VVIRDTWIRTAGNSAAAFLALLALTIALAPSLAWRPGNGTPAAWTWITMLALAGVTGVGSLHALRAAARRPPAIAPPIPLLREFAPFLVFCLAAVVVVVVDVVGRGQPNWLAAVDALLVAGFMANCMVGNGARLHLAPLRGRARLCVTTASLAVAFLVYWSLTGGVSNEAGTALGFGPSLGAFAVSFALTAAMTAAGTSLVHGFGGGAFRTPYPPLAGAAQDVYLGGVLWLILGWLPQLVWAHIAEGKERLAAVGSVTGGFLLLFGPAFLWVLENNDTHNGRQRKGLNVPEYAQEEARAYVRIKSLPRRVQRYWTHSDMSHDLDEQKAAALDGHTATQNLLALTLAALTIIGGVGIASAVKDKS